MAIHRITMLMRMDGNEQRHVFYAGNVDTTTADAIDAAVSIRDAYEDTLSGILSAEWQLYGATVQDVSAALLPVIPVELTDVDGTVVTNDWAPLQVAGIVTFRSYTVKPNRGHKFIGGLTELAMVNGVFTAAALGIMQAWATQLLGLQVVDPKWGIALAHFDQLLNRVTSANTASTASVNEVPGTLRRRRKGKGI